MARSRNQLQPVGASLSESSVEDAVQAVAKPGTSELLVRSLVEMSQATTSQSVEIEGLRVEQRAGFESLAGSQKNGFVAIKDAIERTAKENADRDKKTNSKLTSMDTSLLGLLEYAKKRDEREQEDHAMTMEERRLDLTRKTKVQDARANVSVVLWSSAAKWAAAIGGAGLISAFFTWLLTR